ncbi:hypothetical protein C8R45DRAFT_970082 [Mycena sanguinolenta]|nr:hypothetical protein C8R45DRAFT_970082 [Mycena sanguinolenta]
MSKLQPGKPVDSTEKGESSKTEEDMQGEVEQFMDALAAMTISAQPSVASSAPLEILVCRYECGKIVKERRTISENFIAVSHVWGNADWRQLECVEDEILVSEEKAHFITHDLPNVVENTWFWMDILSVDQRDGDARVAVTQHIPSIFRAAIKTVVIRESTGFRDCCVEAAGRSREFMGKTRYGRPRNDQDEDIDFTEGMDGRQKLGLHLQREHAEDNIEDGILSRLWPLQEIMMSNCVRFVKCKPVASTGPATRTARSPGYDLVGSLSTLALAWDTFGSKDETNMWHRTGTGRWDFLDAFFHCRETRRGNTVAEIPELPQARDLCIHLSSMRRTSKPRDFILAIMPQYGFYRMPQNARRMSFPKLYIDCCRQLRGRAVEIGPLFIESENPFDGQIGELRAGVPEPVYLGDLVKLFNGPVQRSPEHNVIDLMTLEKQPCKTGIAKAEALRAAEEVYGAGNCDPDKVNLALAVHMVHLTVICIFASRTLWLSSQAELLNEIGRVMPGSDRHRVLQAFSMILGEIDWSEGSRVNAEKITYTNVISQLRGVSWETFALLAAMVGCGVPLSAFEWAEQHLDVLHLKIFEGRVFMALAPKHVANNDSWYFLSEVDEYVFGRDGPMPRLSLLASTLGQDNILTQCIFPPDIALSDG